MDTTIEHMLELGAGAGADCLDPLSALTKDNRALAGPLDINRLLDPHTAVRPVLPVFGLNCRGVGKLLVQLEEDLLARDLRRDDPLRRV